MLLVPYIIGRSAAYATIVTMVTFSCSPVIVKFQPQLSKNLHECALSVIAYYIHGALVYYTLPVVRVLHL